MKAEMKPEWTLCLYGFDFASHKPKTKQHNARGQVSHWLGQNERCMNAEHKH